jgi:NAD(P)-dependent dehydrogenase (short-subunit alcohol dehydrogenase family)
VPSFRLDGRVALVTGAGPNNGHAFVKTLAEAGADVAVSDLNDANSQEGARLAGELGRRSISVPFDITDLNAVKAGVALATDALGPIDILVNNAGIASRGQTVAKTDPEEVERVVRIHAIGPHWLCGLIIPGMRTRPRGDIVFISSAATRGNAAASAPYNMGKHAMESLAFTLSKEERSKGIHVNIVAPGLVKTEMGRRLMKAFDQDIEAMDPAAPYGRVCRPEDVANVVRWLVSDGAGYLNGERIYVDGGAQ